MFSNYKSAVIFTASFSAIIVHTVVCSSDEESDCEVDSAKYSYSKRRWHTGPFTQYEAFGNLDPSPIVYPGYRPVKVWFLSRHGTRYPGKKIVEGMFHKLPQIRDRLQSKEGNECYNDGLAKWAPPPHLAKSATRNLTDQGRVSVACMGKRFRNRFRDLIPARLDTRIEVKYTKTPRTEESARHFMKGLFRSKSADEQFWLHEADPLEDKILKFDTACSWWKYVRERENEGIFLAFNTGREMSDLVVKIGERCSLPQFNFETLMLVHETCCFELAWFDHSPWCSVLKENELKAVEYAQDLELYALDGYGDEWNHKIACPLFNDMHSFLTSDSDSVVRINFTHLSIVVKLLAHLGLYRTEELRADNYLDESVQTRKWRASDFAGFNANFTFVLYLNDVSGEKAILCMLNERAVRIPGCPTDTDLCPLVKFEEVFHESILQCSYDEWCQNDRFKEVRAAYKEQKKQKQFVNLLGDDESDSSESSRIR